MKVITYKRVSTKGQGESGLGLEAQDRDIALYLSNYASDADVIGNFIDIASGKDSDRIEYKKAVALAEKTGAILLVAKLDRVSRDVETVAGLIKRVSLKVACMPFADNFQLHLYAALAEQEREFISLRTKAALQAKKARGEDLKHGMTFKRADVQATATATKQAKAAQYREQALPMIKACVQATATYSLACDMLNSQGVRTARGGLFHPTTLSRLLKAS